MCFQKDDLSPFLEKIRTSVDAVVLGTPLYMGEMNGMTHSLYERIIYPFHNYRTKKVNLHHKIKGALGKKT